MFSEACSFNDTLNIAVDKLYGSVSELSPSFLWNALQSYWLGNLFLVREIKHALSRGSSLSWMCVHMGTAVLPHPYVTCIAHRVYTVKLSLIHAVCVCCADRLYVALPMIVPYCSPYPGTHKQTIPLAKVIKIANIVVSSLKQAHWNMLVF